MRMVLGSLLNDSRHICWLPDCRLDFPRLGLSVLIQLLANVGFGDVAEGSQFRKASIIIVRATQRGTSEASAQAGSIKSFKILIINMIRQQSASSAELYDLTCDNVMEANRAAPSMLAPAP